MTRPRTVAPTSSCCAESGARAPARWGLLLAVAVAAGACGDQRDRALVPREHRFGIFRDLVLFQRPASEGGAYFLDRFESTRADFASWRGESSGREPDVRPQTEVDLHQARRFAQWRFCRLPRSEEWRYAATQGGSYVFPWGNIFRGTEANTGRLGLGMTTPVGAFASGSQAGPFDLVGNVSEWTETVVDDISGQTLPYSRQVTRREVIARVIGLPEWPNFADPLEGELYPYEQAGAMPLGLRVWLPLWAPMPERWLTPDPTSPFVEFEFQETQAVDRDTEILDMPGRFEFNRTPGLACWLLGAPVPTDWLVFAVETELSRKVVGGHFRSLVQNKQLHPRDRIWPPGYRDPRTGVRLACDARGLLEALLRYRGPMPGLPARNTLRRFLADPDHQEVLQRAWASILQRAKASGSGQDRVLRPLLEAELGSG